MKVSDDINAVTYELIFFQIPYQYNGMEFVSGSKIIRNSHDQYYMIPIGDNLVNGVAVETGMKWEFESV